jgi:hypothetical protein
MIVAQANMRSLGLSPRATLEIKRLMARLILGPDDPAGMLCDPELLRRVSEADAPVRRKRPIPRRDPQPRCPDRRRPSTARRRPMK